MEDTVNHIEFLKTNIPISLQLFNNKDLKPTQTFTIGLLERLYYSSFSFSQQIGDYQKFKQLDFSIGLTLRALLLDCLISFNLYKIVTDLETSGLVINEIEKVANEYCNRVLADGLQQTLQYFQKSKELNLIDETRLKSIFEDLAKKYEFFLETPSPDVNQPKVRFSKPMKNAELFENLAKDNDLKFLTGLYDAYNFYSKYNHFGILYFWLTRQDFELCKKQFESCINIFLKHYLTLLLILQQFSNDDKNVMRELIVVAEYYKKNNS